MSRLGAALRAATKEPDAASGRSQKGGGAWVLGVGGTS
jgi:hypothetical protein